jgi:GNAT superfamily N-acetyltransferase
MIEIGNATTEQQLGQVRDLLRAFVDWHRRRHREDRQLIDDYFQDRAFEEELAALPGQYAPPRGRLLLAHADSRSAGCAALREIDGDTCEMKRMFVYPEFHGKRIGRALAERLVQEARRIGYRSMLLDTSFRQKEAQTLYRKMGFKPVEPYYDLPEALKNWLIFMALEL